MHLRIFSDENLFNLENEVNEFIKSLEASNLIDFKIQLQPETESHHGKYIATVLIK